MEKEIALAGYGQISKQRNLFLTLSLGLSITCAGLTLKLLNQEQKIILVPGLTQEVWTSDSGVSREYLEQNTQMYLPMLLDLSGDIINYKAGQIFKYISQSDPEYLRKLQEYFVEAKEKYSKFGLSTHFTVKNMEIDGKNLAVTVNGALTCIYGKNGFELIPRTYKLTFEWTGGKLRLREFLRVFNKDEQAKDGGSALTDFINGVRQENMQ